MSCYRVNVTLTFVTEQHILKMEYQLNRHLDSAVRHVAMCSEMLHRCGGRDQNPTAGLAMWWVIHNGQTETPDRCCCSCSCVQSGVVMLRARQPAVVEVFQRTAELAGRASGRPTACTAVLAHERHLANRRCILNCWSQLVPLCDRNCFFFLRFQMTHTAYSPDRLYQHTHSRYTQPRLRAQLRAL